MGIWVRFVPMMYPLKAMWRLLVYPLSLENKLLSL